MASPRVRRTLLITLQWALTVAVIGAMALVLASKWPQLHKLLSFSAGTVAIIAVGALALFFMNGVVLQAMARPFDLHLPLPEAIVIALVDATLNYLPLKGGTIATGAVLWSRYRLMPTKFAAMVTGASVINVWVCTTMGSVLLLTRGVAVAGAWVLLVVPTAGVAALVVWDLRFDGHVADTEHAHWFVRTVNRILDGVRAIFSDLTLVLQLVFYNAIRVGIAALQLKVAFGALSTPIGWSTALIMSSLATVLGRMSIVPGGLGFREGGVAGVAALLGISATVGLAASGIERTITVTFIAICGIPATLYVSKTTPWARLTRSGDEEESEA